MKSSSKTKDRRGKNMTEIRVKSYPIANPEERQEILRDLAISSEFEMRYRGLFEYYGKDLIAYKREKPTDQNRNEFLRILSSYMTTHLENNCPTSWKKCKTSFWEEFIFGYYPHMMLITPEENEVDTFLLELKKFIQWLDKRAGTSFHPLIEKYAAESVTDLKLCESLLNSLFLKDYPLIYQDEWNPNEDIEKINLAYTQCTDRTNSFFEVTNIYDDILEITDLNSNRTFNLLKMPCKLFEPGIIISGIIGKKESDLFWDLYQTEGIYPNRAKKYMEFA